MLTLFHYPMNAGSRFTRLTLAEYAVPFTLIEELPWVRRREFLQLNPAGTVPVLLAEADQPVAGTIPILEYLDETRGSMAREKRLMPEEVFDRAEARRLTLWYLEKCENEVTRHMVRERVTRPLMPTEKGGGSPDAGALRAARSNIKQHLKYTNYLAGNRDWLAGDKLSIADLAAGATLSILDYLGELDWSGHDAAREWYARVKSRPSFRPLLQERVRGLPPSAHYADPDF
ncbi:glutathione S-transferase family protein [Notoacmeibacter sp. MSK16QG-6]|uniref:glutathione S-transferase family protein n=1 Tax=Notoacmeibacter sp. MSK16QG-6 TaxID=2957982 RepID=UPI0020A02B87|nr:glutathione S-transferase family protein [Notoacmeibacter sp. MSK16QG-6]MCP1198843.1 glutathione S-transferase family protein [Notoacmeibacter sp. MSK16QG-6]